jgi:D-arabinose 1-dehydrogenase-like Zn-dependent alcohol dehydrogenase
MRALVFGVPPEPFEVTDDADTLTRNLAHSPVSLRDVPDPQPLHDDWVVARPRLTGICGSDSKQILLDFGEGDTDNAMAAFCSFPQVMGHEVVADVVALGPTARGLEIGQRVVLNPWLSCGPRGIEPRCPACETGDYSLCWSFTDGDIKPGIHTGVSADVTGGYAELMPAHDSMLFAVPDSVPDEVAVFADPFSVSLHAITRHPPPSTGRVLVYGAGSRFVCGRGAAHAVPTGRGRGGGALRRAGGVGPSVRRGQGACARTAAGGHRGARRVGRRPTAPAIAGAADGLPRLD